MKHQVFVTLTPMDSLTVIYSYVLAFMETYFFDPTEEIQMLYEYNGFLTEC